ncbi:E3 ubiquitin-protein ligase TRIM71-like [Mercenaria mercenaria]|uniref:E3 ubiquitin-protein ligase TRIM71-like n=1 Tax=Mercenaria mercenaria TaxID=6596 RepID=UPI00234EDB50|nr:E3 ubiquitin-protein ligase TRIM71-like [Mercenaria mercenaria]
MALFGRTASPKFVSSMSRGSGEDFEIFCQPCDRDNIRLPAFAFCVDCEEHLCEYCLNHHKRAKPSRQHTLLDKQNMPQSLQVSTSQPDPHALPGDLTKPCYTHKKEMIKFYCHDHNALLCSVCVTLKHQSTACRVDYIPDISGYIVNSNEYRRIIKEIDTMTGIFQDTAGGLKKMTEKSNASLTDALAEIKKLRKEINQRLDAMENEAENEARSLKKDNDQRLKTAQATCDDVIKDLQESSDNIKQLNTSKQADRLFVELKATEQLIHENKKYMPHLMTVENVEEYHFKPNLDISALFENEKSLGTLTTKALKPPVNVSVKQYSHQGEICVSTSQDKGTCFITGMTVPTSDILIVADYGNFSIKMIDSKSYSIIGLLKLDRSPWDVTTVSEDKLAVTTPYSKEIQFVSFKSNRLKRKGTIKVEGTCYGIYCYKEQLIVLFKSPAKLQIIDLKGKVLKSVTKNILGVDIFSNPGYVTASSSSIYVSDREKKAVIQLNWQGDVTGVYRVLRAPAGLAMLADGSVFLSDYHDKSCSIKNIPGDCTRGEVVLKDLRKPFAICWCEANKTLYISSFTQYASADNFVSVYKMS